MANSFKKNMSVQRNNNLDRTKIIVSKDLKSNQFDMYDYLSSNNHFMPDLKNGATNKIQVGNMDQHINYKKKERDTDEQFRFNSYARENNQTMTDYELTEKKNFKNKYGNNSMNNSYYKNN